jgi:hypothetical protein
MTADCPVGKRRVRLKMLATVVSGGVFAGIAAAVVAHEIHRPQLDELYSVHYSTEDVHHHRLATQMIADIHMSGRDAAFVGGIPPEPPGEDPHPHHPPSRPESKPSQEPGRHLMGAVAPPPPVRGSQKSSCNLPPTKATL